MKIFAAATIMKKSPGFRYFERYKTLSSREIVGYNAIMKAIILMLFRFLVELSNQDVNSVRN